MDIELLPLPACVAGKFAFVEGALTDVVCKGMPLPLGGPIAVPLWPIAVPLWPIAVPLWPIAVPLWPIAGRVRAIAVSSRPTGCTYHAYL